MNGSKVRLVFVPGLIALGVILSGCAGRNSQEVARVRTDTQSQAANAVPSPRVVEMAVTSDGFVPAQLRVKAGQPVRLVITRKTERTCATQIVIKDYHIQQPLPLNQAVEISFTPTRAGTVRYACAMDMIAGVLTVE